MIIRDEQPDDVALIRTVVKEAFRTAPARPGQVRGPDAGKVEVAIVDGLRRAGALTLSLVATLDGDELVGHVAFSPVKIDGRHDGWFGMGPVAVWPECQRTGVGSKLVRAGLERLRESRARGVVVLGDPAYYGRFGFRAQDRLRYPGPPTSHFMALGFEGTIPAGVVAYHSAFETSG